MATTVKQAFQKLKENLEITGLQEETVSTRQKSVREVLDAGLEESSLYSAKGHFAAAHSWASFHLIIGIPVVVLAAVAGSSFICNNNILAGDLSFDHRSSFGHYDVFES